MKLITRPISNKIDFSLELRLQEMEENGEVNQLLSGLLKYKENISLEDIQKKYPGLRIREHGEGIAFYDCPAGHLRSLIEEEDIFYVDAPKKLRMLE